MLLMLLLYSTAGAGAGHCRVVFGYWRVVWSGKLEGKVGVAAAFSRLLVVVVLLHTVLVHSNLDHLLVIAVIS